MYSGVLFHTLYVTTTNSKLNKRECSSSFTSIFRAHSSIHRDLLLTAQQKSALNQNKIRNVIAYKNSGNCPYSQSFGAPRNRGPRLSLFSPMVNPRLPGRWILPEWQNFFCRCNLGYEWDTRVDSLSLNSLMRRNYETCLSSKCQTCLCNIVIWD